MPEIEDHAAEDALETAAVRRDNFMSEAASTRDQGLQASLERRWYRASPP
jgi:hypothetical protein